MSETWPVLGTGGHATFSLLTQCCWLQGPGPDPGYLEERCCCHDDVHKHLLSRLPASHWRLPQGTRRSVWWAPGRMDLYRSVCTKAHPSPQLPHTGDHASIPDYTRHGSWPREVGKLSGSPGPSQSRLREPGLAWGPGALSQLPAIPRHHPFPNSSDFCMGPHATHREEHRRSCGSWCRAWCRLPARENHRERTEGTPNVAAAHPLPSRVRPDCPVCKDQPRVWH